LERTNVLLERIALALEAVVSNAWSVDLSAEQLSAEQLAAAERDPNPRIDMVDEEVLAALEWLEADGTKIPPEVYAELGVEPPIPDPRAEQEREEREQAEDQPDPPDADADDDLIQTFKRTKLDLET
jgi:hypothetical protein